MNICFYNCCGFGDVLFSASLVKHLCVYNPDITFYYYVNYGHILLENIPNLKYIGTYENRYIQKLETDEQPRKCYKIKSGLDITFNIDLPGKNMSEIQYNNTKFLGFSIWCHELECADLIAPDLEKKFFEKIGMINEKYKLGLNIPPLDRRDLLLKFPDVDIDKFKQWYSTIGNKKLIFFYNYKPRSWSWYPMDYINNYIAHLADCFASGGLGDNDYIFIAARHNHRFNGIENIKSCDKDFECEETPDCTNLLMIEKINRYCEYTFTIVSGGSWAFMNSTIDSQKNKKYLINYEASPYTKKLNNWYKYSTGSDKDVIQETRLDDIFHIISGTL